MAAKNLNYTSFLCSKKAVFCTEKGLARVSFIIKRRFLMSKSDFCKLALMGIIGGLLLGSQAMADTLSDQTIAGSGEAKTTKNGCKASNGCKGMNGCSGEKGTKEKDANSCAGPGGCAGTTDKTEE